MGNKHDLAPDVASIVEDVRPGRPFLDLFCGMCSVGAEVAMSGRPVWGNDVQHLATATARCLIAEPDEPPCASSLRSILRPAFSRNVERLEDRLEQALAEEAAILAHPTHDAYSDAYARWRHTGNDDERREEVAALRLRRASVPYRLCSLSFAYGYFGLRQAVALDSLRYAIDRARARGAVTSGEASWCVLALAQTASVVASSPGHFAQYLRASSDEGLKRIVRQRRRDVFETFFEELAGLGPVNDAEWRGRNRVFRRDALRIWPALRTNGFTSSVVYADPPYSTDHYSRYYHVLETLLRYDYPLAAGAGRYRPDRFTTPFSLKTRVASAFDSLFRGVAGLDSTLVLSYPANGLLLRSGRGDVDALLRRHFRSVQLVLRKDVSHSTLGGRHGSASNGVEELIWVAT